MDDTLPRLNTVFQDVFDDESINISRSTTAATISAWDSVMHITLMMAAERAFKVRFRSGDVAGLKNVGELIDLIDRLRKN
jgi:acyl carrier protein